MNDRAAAVGLVGRSSQLERLKTWVERALAVEGSTVLVAGQAGIGKTSLVRAAATFAAGRGVRVTWGTCVDGDGAPGYWPWTQAFNALARTVGPAHARDLAGEDLDLLSAIAPALRSGNGGVAGDQPLLLMDATARWLGALCGDGPVMIVVDDLQWADGSSLALLEFLARSQLPAGLCLVGAYRHDELPADVQHRLNALQTCAEHVQLEGLERADVHALVERVVGGVVSNDVTDIIHRRSAGHPFFVRELAHLSMSSGTTAPVPFAVRDAIERRVSHISDRTVAMLKVVAVSGNEVMPDVVADVLAWSAVDVMVAVREGVAAGVLAIGDDRHLFAHDLLRETLVAGLDPSQDMAIHLGIGSALEHRVARGGEVAPADVARHFIAAVALDGPERAVRWALAAAAADRGTLAFNEAAGHLRRLRSAANDARVGIPDELLVDVFLAEADALACAGSSLDAKGLLRMGWDLALRSGDGARIALVALAATQLGSRFSSRRDSVIADLETALSRVADTDKSLEARLTATMARELQHSVAEQRPRAGPLSARALDLGRRSGDPAALLACLLARHDVLWTPGTADERAEVAREIVAVAQEVNDVEHHAEGLLLLATAELERGSGAYLPALESCFRLLDELGQPRHRYTVETRRAAVAMLHGELDAASARIDAATNLGLRIREPDTGNVRMSQRLELVRARGEPDELQAFATEAIEHWTGAAVHANAVAAGFHARAGATERARQHVATVLDLGTWRADRSYLRSVFVRELSYAAIALDDLDLCRELFDELSPLEASCGVNGALVAFAGSHAHTAGLLATALGCPDEAAALLGRARGIYERLGAPTWLAELDRSCSPTLSGPRDDAISRLRRVGPMWQIEFRGHVATIPDSKGAADLAILLSRPGTDVHALELMGSHDRSGSSGPIVDRAALQTYRQRLVDLDEDAAEADRNHDDARRARLEGERQALLTELRRVTSATGQPRQFANHPAERARKAVSARIRMAISSIAAVLPELADHLNQTIATGTQCRYRSDGSARWETSDGRPGDAS